ncbi:MAG: ABC transporter ATP-binding protein [Armatimonadetes bacterium]|nr:ABC transporter ATP-binding protein [Armatimonadota bacterium]
MPGGGAAVLVDRLSFFYALNGNRVEALKEVSFSIEGGGIYALIGPSGCGKSTLLYILAGLLPPRGGRVLINGERPLPGRRATSLILQEYGLLPWKTVWDNVVLGLVIRRLPAGEIRRKGEKVLKEMGLWELRRRYPAELSGGQRQRVAIARSLATEPDLLLMDEPFSSLDALTREALQDVLQNILQSGGLTVLLVTHNIEEAAFLGRRVIVLTPHPGSVYQIFENPRACSPGYRKSAEFFRLCTELRNALEFAQIRAQDANAGCG